MPEEHLDRSAGRRIGATCIRVGRWFRTAEEDQPHAVFLAEGPVVARRAEEGVLVRGGRRVGHEFDRIGASPTPAARPSITATSTASRSRVRTALVVTCFALLASACSLGTSQQYISSENDDLDFALPNEFRDLGIAGQGFEWSRAYTGSPGDPSMDEPFVRATVIPLTNDEREVVDLQNLRVLLLGDRDPIEDAEDLHLVRHEPWVDEHGSEGNRIQVDVLDAEEGDLTFAHVAVLDAQRTRIAQVQVFCSTTCFVNNIDTIDDILDSVRFTP